jgi:hypothetical protein
LLRAASVISRAREWDSFQLFTCSQAESTPTQDGKSALQPGHWPSGSKSLQFDQCGPWLWLDGFDKLLQAIFPHCFMMLHGWRCTYELNSSRTTPSLPLWMAYLVLVTAACLAGRLSHVSVPDFDKCQKPSKLQGTSRNRIIELMTTISW